MPSAGGTGMIAWVGLAAADAPAAVEFYTAAFGWEAAREADHTKLRKGGGTWRSSIRRRHRRERRT
jgi:predicted enzyme related to lactoylglutathione lyase